MSDQIAFTDNIRDLSNNSGYQFEFVCERCGNGYRSAFTRDKVDLGRSLLRSAGDMFGGSRVAQMASEFALNRGTNSAAKDKAMRAAVETVSSQFKQCKGCGDWSCEDVCWNAAAGQCVTCSPLVSEEIARAQAAAQVTQIRDATQQADWTSGLTIATKAPVTCPSCGTHTTGSKFCSSCGTSLVATATCSSCGYTKNAIGSAFCSDCGHGLS